MDKYNGLLSKVSQQYHILRGTQETEDEWETRLVYSICGMMAYASLWDDAEEPISIVHMKGRVRSVLGSYKSLYPELSGAFPHISQCFAMIYFPFLASFCHLYIPILSQKYIFARDMLKMVYMMEV